MRALGKTPAEIAPLNAYEIEIVQTLVRSTATTEKMKTRRRGKEPKFSVEISAVRPKKILEKPEELQMLAAGFLGYSRPELELALRNCKNKGNGKMVIVRIHGQEVRLPSTLPGIEEKIFRTVRARTSSVMRLLKATRAEVRKNRKRKTTRLRLIRARR